MAVMAWFGFVGSWLLVAGPLLQGVQELRDRALDREGIEAAVAAITPLPRPAAWWWLVPPVMLAKRQRRSRAFWREAFAKLPADQVARISGTRPMVYGWFMVSAGGAFLALRETWELADRYGWPAWAFPSLVAGLGALSVLNAAVGTA